MTSVTAPALYMVTDWDRRWRRDESWGVTGRQATKVQKWRAEVNCSRCEQRQLERVGPRWWIGNCGRRSVMKTRQNGVADEPRRPPLDTVHRRGTTVQTREGICIRGRHIWKQSTPKPSTSGAGEGAEWCGRTAKKKRWAEQQSSSLTGAVTEDAMVCRPELHYHSPVEGGQETSSVVKVQFISTS